MKNLITISEETFGRAKPSADVEYEYREAARAVLLNDQGGIYLLNVTTQGYHKLPGGGIDEGEDKKQALEREIIEEVGCEAEVGAEIGEVVEYRHYEDESLEQHSYNYIARQTGELGVQSLEQGEIDAGHDLVIAKDIDDAIRILDQDEPKNVEGGYIRLRDITILKEAKKLL